MSLILADRYTAEARFRMLRLAIYRRLTCEQLSEALFRVSSSREGHPPYTVDVTKGCPCDSALPCSHLALARDRWFQWEADTQTPRGLLLRPASGLRKPVREAGAMWR